MSTIRLRPILIELISTHLTDLTNPRGKEPARLKANENHLLFQCSLWQKVAVLQSGVMLNGVFNLTNPHELVLRGSRKTGRPGG